MTDNDIFKAVENYARKNHFIDVEDKLPIFICSVGAHIFNTINKCSSCDFDPEKVDPGEYSIPACPMRHEQQPFYTPMSRLPDTRIHILMRGMKGSGKSVLVELFLAERTGLLYSAQADIGVGYKTMIGPNSVTEAGMFGSVDEEGNIMGRPLARELCGGFLGFEEFSAITDAARKEHSIDMKNQLLTSTDNGRVNKGMRAGWVRYSTRYTIWAGTQPARFELESGLDRRFFIIDIEMSPEKEAQFKQAQHKQSNMTQTERISLIEDNRKIKEWFVKRQMEAVLEPPTAVIFDRSLNDWISQPEVRSFEADLFRRLAIGYHMMKPNYKGGEALNVWLDSDLKLILDKSLLMRRNVMDADIKLIKDTFWAKDISKSNLVKEVTRMVTMGDYQSAKRWIEESLQDQPWYKEFIPEKEGRGRKGVVCRIGHSPAFEAKAKKGSMNWGNKNAE